MRLLLGMDVPRATMRESSRQSGCGRRASIDRVLAADAQYARPARRAEFRYSQWR